MNVYQGKSVFGGIAIGHLCVYKKGEQQVTRQKIEDVEAEVKRFQDAKEAAQAQLGELYDKAVKEVGEANAAIFEMHQMVSNHRGAADCHQGAACYFEWLGERHHPAVAIGNNMMKECL